MSEEDRLWSIIEQKVGEQLGSYLKVASYFEYQLDLLTNVVAGLLSAVDSTKLSAETQNLLNELSKFTAVSSVDFTSLTSPYEAFKLPGAITIKKSLADLRKAYLNAALKTK